MERPAWDEMCFLHLRNTKNEPIKVNHLVPIAKLPSNDLTIPANGSVGVNMQFAATVTIAGVTIGPITQPDPRELNA